MARTWRYSEPIVLASASPRRLELLSAVADDLTVIPADIDESLVRARSPRALVRELSRRKALAVAGRAAFFMVPNFKPILAIVIISGASLGREAGFLIGAMSAFVSNFIFGQGPWTVWQMFAMAVIGYLAGLIFAKHAEGRIKWPLIVFGAISAFFIYGGITDIWTILVMTDTPDIAAAVMVYTAALPFNMANAAATVIFTFLLAGPVIEKLARVKKKYRLETFG